MEKMIFVVYESSDMVLVTTPELEGEFKKEFGFEDHEDEDGPISKHRWTGEEVDALWDTDENAAEKIAGSDIFDRQEIEELGLEMEFYTSVSVY
jgi:hypothetical protein